MSTQNTSEPQQSTTVRIVTGIITGIFAGLTRAITDVVLHHLTTGR